jgi:hypothetical protein
MKLRCLLGPLGVLLGLFVIGVVSAQGPGVDRPVAKVTKTNELGKTATISAPPGNIEIRVFVLKHAKAAGVAKALQELFPKDEYTLRFASEPDLNVLLVRGGNREELQVVEVVLDKLETISHEQKKISHDLKQIGK